MKPDTPKQRRTRVRALVKQAMDLLTEPSPEHEPIAAERERRVADLLATAAGLLWSPDAREVSS